MEREKEKREREREREGERESEREIQAGRESDLQLQPPSSPSIRSAIHEPQQLTSPIGFLFLKLPPAPCLVLPVFGTFTLDAGKVVSFRSGNCHFYANPICSSGHQSWFPSPEPGNRTRIFGYFAQLKLFWDSPPWCEPVIGTHCFGDGLQFALSNGFRFQQYRMMIIDFGQFASHIFQVSQSWKMGQFTGPPQHFGVKTMVSCRCSDVHLMSYPFKVGKPNAIDLNHPRNRNF